MFQEEDSLGHAAEKIAAKEWYPCYQNLFPETTIATKQVFI